MNTDQEEYDRVFAAVKQEYSKLIAGRDHFSRKELYHLRRYAKYRTNIKKSEHELTYEEKSWLVFYKKIDSRLEEIMDTKEKQEMDKHEQELELAEERQRDSEYLNKLGKEIEKLFSKQLSYIYAFTDNSEENKYLVYKKQAENIILDKSVPKINRIKFADLLLKYIGVFENEIVENLYTINDSIQKKLAMVKQTLHTISIPENTERENKATDIYKEWFPLSKETYLNRVMASNAIVLKYDLDKFVAKAGIQDNFNPDELNALLEEQTNTHLMEIIHATNLLDAASERENELSEKRKLLARKLWGDFDKEDEEVNVFLRNLINSTNLSNTASEKEIKLSEKRRPLPRELWGDVAKDDEQTNVRLTNITNSKNLMNIASENEFNLSEKRKTQPRELWSDVGEEDEPQLGATTKKSKNKINHKFNSTEEQFWIRVMKVITIGIWLIGLSLISLISYSLKDFSAFIFGTIVLSALSIALSKAFFYVFDGQKQ